MRSATGDQSSPDMSARSPTASSGTTAGPPAPATGQTNSALPLDGFHSKFCSSTVRCALVATRRVPSGDGDDWIDFANVGSSVTNPAFVTCPGCTVNDVVKPADSPGPPG